MSSTVGDPAALDLTLDDAHRTAMRLLPQGPVWPRDPDGVLARTVRGLVGVHHGAWRRVVDLLGESDPRGAYELLRMWEIDCGLPDPCLTNPPVSIDGRRTAVVARRAEGATTTPMAFIRLGAMLGYEVEILEYRPFRVYSTCDAFLHTARAGWPHTFMVNVIGANRALRLFRTGSGCNEFLREWVVGDLECVITRIAPAHTEVIFAYNPTTPLVSIWDAGASIWDGGASVWTDLVA